MRRTLLKHGYIEAEEVAIGRPHGEDKPIRLHQACPTGAGRRQIDLISYLERTLLRIGHQRTGANPDTHAIDLLHPTVLRSAPDQSNAARRRQSLAGSGSGRRWDWAAGLARLQESALYLPSPSLPQIQPWQLLCPPGESPQMALWCASARWLAARMLTLALGRFREHHKRRGWSGQMLRAQSAPKTQASRSSIGAYCGASMDNSAAGTQLLRMFPASPDIGDR